MADHGSWATSPGTRRSMQGNRRRDTAPELTLRRALHARGHRYRVDTRPLPDLNRRADLVFRSRRVAVFVHGCYWHGCPEHYTAPRRNGRFWSEKVERNRARDRDTAERLTSAGWQVVVVWEHDDVATGVELVEAALRRAQATSPVRTQRDQGSGAEAD